MSSEIAFLDWCKMYVHRMQELDRLKAALPNINGQKLIAFERSVKNVTEGIKFAKKMMAETSQNASKEELEEGLRLIEPYKLKE